MVEARAAARTRLAAVITGPFALWALAAGALGVLFAPMARRGTDAIPALLGVMVFATGFTVPPAGLGAALRRPERVLWALAAQYGPLALLAFWLSRLPLSAPVSIGILVIGVAPTEVSAGVMTLLAGGDAALGTALMAASLLASTVLTPTLLAGFAGRAVFVDRPALLQELMLSVSLPLIGAVALRGLLARRLAERALADSLRLFAEQPTPARRAPERADRAAAALLAAADALAPAVAALVVLALLFIVAAAARDVLLSADVFAVVPFCLLLNATGYAAGWALFRLLRAPELAVRAGVFALGMREFGVAATVAAAVLPAAAGVAAVYGMVILFTAPLLVRLYGTRGRRS